MADVQTMYRHMQEILGNTDTTAADKFGANFCVVRQNLTSTNGLRNGAADAVEGGDFIQTSCKDADSLCEIVTSAVFGALMATEISTAAQTLADRNVSWILV